MAGAWMRLDARKMTAITDRPTLGPAMPPGTGVCVINLDARVDRWEQFQAEVAPALAPLPLHRVSAVAGVKLPGYGEVPWFRGRKRDATWAARGGCVLSHRAALLHARDSGWPWVLVLEDDLERPVRVDAATGVALAGALAAHAADVCYLGFTDPQLPWRQLTALGSGHALHQVFGCSTTHAYLASARAIEWILARLPEPADIWPWVARHRAIDRFYYRHLSPALKVTAVSPTWFDQRGGFSDIIGREVGAYAESHRTEVEVCHPSDAVFQAALRARAAAFRRAGWADAFRGCWKRLRGF